MKRKTVKKNSVDDNLGKIEHCYEKENGKKEQCRREPLQGLNTVTK